MGGQPVKKILVNARGLSTQEVEVKSLHIRTIISINREGVTTFAVFLLSFFVRTRRKAISGIGCRSPPFNLDFKKIQIDWRKLQCLKSIQTEKRTSITRTL